ncbi:MAG: DUF4440 domain-containing protein [Opitutaceae bacterium]
MKLLKTSLLLGLIGPCLITVFAGDPTTWIEEVRSTELAFAQKAAEVGLKEAFLAYADEQAVINRGGRIHRGKEAIAAWFDGQTLKDVSLVWTPDFVDISGDGTLAYTYGPFTLKGTTESGEAVDVSGIFHTVWKHQPDGSWKYVYD